MGFQVIVGVGNVMVKVTPVPVAPLSSGVADADGVTVHVPTPE